MLFDLVRHARTRQETWDQIEMPTASTSPNKVHAFLLKIEKSLVVVPLDALYSYTVSMEASGAVLTLHGGSALPSQNAGLLASFTTLYGVNGCGKTRLMLALCSGAHSGGMSARFAAIWTDPRGLLHVSSGGAMRRVRLISTVGDVRRKPTPKFSTIFYTTSPFEGPRRDEVARSGTIDCSPSFDGVSTFSPRSLFESYQHLSDKETFISEASVSIAESAAPPILDSFDRMSRLFRSRSRAASLRPVRYPREIEERRSRIATLDKILPRRTRRRLQLASEIISISPGSTSQLDVDQILKELDGELQKFAQKRPRSDEARERNREELAFRASKLIDTLVLLVAPQVSRWNATLQSLIGRGHEKASVAALDRRVGDIVRGEPELVEHLTASGILTWRFQNLSSGQVSYLSLFCQIAAALLSLREMHDAGLESPQARQIVLCVDEGEMFMHPSWQRQFVARLVDFVGTVFPIETPYIHLFISTHSPIVAADTPAGRLFDLTEGRLQNAFGLSPKQTLDSIFDVPDFAGEFSQSRLAAISDALKAASPSVGELDIALALVGLMADKSLKDYLTGLLNGRRAEAQRRSDTV